ncbi:MAG TPA: TaqI-like C-terminal specificity domain-containing protein, partial [Methanocella sp.]|nr:TaqI-like C-terminal specificity domain-containing protein [Methanocella sp.]
DELGPYVLSRAGTIRLNVYQTNAIDNDLASDDPEAARIKRRREKYREGFDYILGNPPYLEAKKMPATVKETCRKRWPEIAGAFDLYVPFILQCNRLLADEGKVSLILPDKFTVAGYARSLRERLLRDFSLVEMADLSGMDVFSRAMVYPIVLSYEKRRPTDGHHVRTRTSVVSPAGLAPEGISAIVPQDLYRSVGHNCTFFGLPAGGDVAGMLKRIFDDGVPLGDYVSFRSTVSFHVKGLREQFVRRAFDRANGPVLKYLGGRSYAKRNEVGLFRFRWEGYHINYDREALKSLNNALPPLSNFTQEKIVLCQHAPRITAAYDAAGEFVTKDVYPIGLAMPGLTRSSLSLKYLAALLNSELMSFVYGTIYKGVQIGGGYYHYLPTWIDVLPVIAPAAGDVRRVERLADAMISIDDEASRFRCVNDVDEIVYRAYDISDTQQAIISKAVPAWGPQVG